MKPLLAALFLSVAAPSFASPYFRLMNPSAIQQSAGVLFPVQGGPTSAVTDIAIVTHSPADGCLIPTSWQGMIPCEDWAPLALGAGGSLTGQATVVADSTINVAPQIAALAFKGITSSSPAVLQDIKTAFDGTGPLKLRIGYGLAGTPVQGGTFEPFDKMFPGRGIGGILAEGSRVVVGAAWTW